MRHVLACNNAVLPGHRIAFLLDDQPVGWLPPMIASALEGFPDVVRNSDSVVLTQPAALPDIAHELANLGLCRWRREAFDVRATPDGPVLSTIDRGAVPSFGVQAAGVHVNGLLRRSSALYIWVARRAAGKLLDPGKLDHIVAGGVPAGLTAAETLVKEAAEEAAIPASLAARSVLTGRISYAMERPEGLRRDILSCYDLELPESFEPRPADDEVEAFELWPIERAFEAVRDTDLFKFNVSLVLIDLFIRQNLIHEPEASELRTALGGVHAA